MEYLFFWVKESLSLMKAAAFFLIWVTLWLPFAVVVGKFIGWRLFQPLNPEQKLPLVLSLYLIVPLIIWGTLKVEGLTINDYGLNWNWPLLRSIIFGLSLGICSLAVIFISESLLGWIKWQKPANYLEVVKTVIIPILFVAIAVGGIEEVIFRGFLYTELQKDYTNIIAGIISSIIFALLHLVWEQKETTPQIPGLWLMGMVLVLARITDDGSVGIAWGLHSGWVWSIICLDTTNAIEYTGKVPEWVTGIGKKPLAGLNGLMSLLLVAIALLAVRL